jgi:hypothetical protein
MNGRPRGMASESARATTTAEARFRVGAANALPRRTAVVALDAASAEILARLATGQWQRASFVVLTACPPSAAVASAAQGNCPDDPDGIDPEIAAADIVVLLATPGSDAPAAHRIGAACRRRGAMTTALVVGHAQCAGLSATLALLRPYAPMLVVASSEDYVADMLTALAHDGP